LVLNIGKVVILILVFAGVGPALGLFLWMCTVSIYTQEFLLDEMYFRQAYDTEFVSVFALSGLVYCAVSFAVSLKGQLNFAAWKRAVFAAASMALVLLISYTSSALYGYGPYLSDLIFLYALALPSGVLGFVLPSDWLPRHVANDA